MSIQHQIKLIENIWFQVFDDLLAIREDFGVLYFVSLVSLALYFLVIK
jgi:hypothetical protein